MISKNLQDKAWYNVTIIGVRAVELGQNNTPALEVAVGFADGSQGSVTLFLSQKALLNTRKRLEALGCTSADLTGSDWLRKLNARLAGTKAAAVAEATDKYGARLSGVFPRGGGGAREVEPGPSPFADMDGEDISF